MRLLKFSILALIISLGLSCSKEEEGDTGTNPTNTKSTFKLKLHHKAGSGALELDKNYTLGTGEIVKITNAHFYLTGIRLMDDEQNITSFADQYFLVNPSVTEIELGEVEAKHYHMLMFGIGVDSLTNHADPTLLDPSNPLAPQVESMHWSWNMGYIFLKIDAEVDIDGDGTFDENLRYHVGFDENYMELQGAIHSNAAGGEHFEPEVKIDYLGLFENVDFSTETNAVMNRALATKLATNTKAAITIEAGSHSHN